MNKSLFSFFAFLFCWAMPGFLRAQLLPPNQPEQDACNALMICGNSFTSPYGYQGVGLINDLTTTPCFGGEGNVMWLRLQINTAGTIVFVISPTTVTDDYDFAIVDLTGHDCSDLSAAPVIRCNFNNNTVPGSNVNGQIGLNTTSTSNFTTSGATGGSYLQQINANAGDVYLIMINNFGTGFSGPVSGFNIDFTGSTATFNQPPPPAFEQILPYCNLSQEITLKLTDNVYCNSIAADASDFYLTPSGTIASVSGTNCTGTGGYTNKIKITFTGTLPNGDYTIHAKAGTDGNTLLGLCNSPLALPDSINFHVGLDPIAFASVDSPACQTLSVNLNTPAACNSIAANGSDFAVTGPSTVYVASATGQGCVPGGFTQKVKITLTAPIAVDGLYKIIAGIGTDGNSLIDSCGRILPPGEQINFKVNSFNGLLSALPDSTICNIGNTVNLYGINNGPAPGGGFNYRWVPSYGVSNPNTLNTQLVVPASLNYYVLETVDANGCYLRDSAKIKVVPFNGALTPLTASVCLDDPIQLVASLGTAYHWYDNPSLSGTPATLSCSACPDPLALPPLGTNTYYVLITSSNGCTDTLKSEITVNPLPVIEAFPADTTVKYGSQAYLSAIGGSFYSWSPSGTLNDAFSSAPVATPKNTTYYVVTGANAFGCLSTDTAIVRVDFRNPHIVPNAFSPNGDGLNDVFKVANLKFEKLLEFRVFDRWGKLVFDTTDPEKGWDGTMNGKPVNLDVYYYQIRLGYADDYVETLKGDITLLR